MNRGLLAMMTLPTLGALIGLSAGDASGPVTSNYHEIFVAVGALLGTIAAKLLARIELKDHVKNCPAHGEIGHLRAEIGELQKIIMRQQKQEEASK